MTSFSKTWAPNPTWWLRKTASFSGKHQDADAAGHKSSGTAISLISLLLLLLLGCNTTTSQVNWDNRVGSLTYPEAVKELGPPANTVQQADGTRAADWLTQRGRPGSVGFGMDAGSATPGVTQSRIPYETPAVPDQYLRLTFGPDGKLVSWKHFTRQPRRS